MAINRGDHWSLPIVGLMCIYIYIYIYIQAGIKHPCTQNLSNSPTGLYIYIYTKNNEKQKSSLLLRYAFDRRCGSSGIAKCFY